MQTELLLTRLIKGGLIKPVMRRCADLSFWMNQRVLPQVLCKVLLVVLYEKMVWQTEASIYDNQVLS